MIYLASASPRRQELLQQLGIPFKIVSPDIVEEPQPHESCRAYVSRLASAKARRGLELIRTNRLPIYPVLGADTEVVVDGQILGKPGNRAEGIAMLRRLSGRTHEVLTAINILDQDEMYQAVSESRVTFAVLSDMEIEKYWNSGEPADKAGAYAVQGRAAAFIERIEGSYSGIVGLPLFELVQLLKRIGYEPGVGRA